MFSDTHFHFHTMLDRGVDGSDLLTKLAKRDIFFLLDIGTKCNDLEVRYRQLEEECSKLPDDLKSSLEKKLYYSGGIWPDLEEIKDRENAVKILKNQIETFPCPEKVIALGECGLDHHWNPTGVDGRCQDDFDQKIYDGERELFQMQIELAKEKSLPLIIHSRDAFDDTLDCIKNMGYHRGIIHCYSYGKDEARSFLDLGWYIAFGGAVTYTKKSKMDEMRELLRYVSDDRILMETDAPYLAPVPFRGQANTPLLIENTYNYVAQAREISPERLSSIVDKNIKELFGI